MCHMSALLDKGDSGCVTCMLCLIVNRLDVSHVRFV